MNLAIGSCKVTTTVSSDNALSIIHSSSDCQLWRVPNSNDGTIFIYHFLWVSRSFFFVAWIWQVDCAQHLSGHRSSAEAIWIDGVLTTQYIKTLWETWGWWILLLCWQKSDLFLVIAYEKYTKMFELVCHMSCHIIWQASNCTRARPRETHGNHEDYSL